MNILSTCKMTYDPSGVPRVLVDYGAEIPAMPIKPALRKGLEVVPLVEALAPFLRPSGNASYAFRIDVFQDEVSDALAWQRVFESLLAVAPLGRKPLRIQVEGIADRYWQFANSFITDHAPERVTNFYPPRLLKSYSVVATGLAQVGP